MTLRAIDVLGAADEVLAEDTRVAAKLLSAHGLKVRLSPYHDHNGAERRPGLIARLSEGARLALISDAGTPLISDPGWKLVHEALEAGIRVWPVPGPSALLAALVASGLPSDRFFFGGFLPPKSHARREALSGLSTIPATLIFYESAARLAACLADMAAVLGPREAAIVREITKRFEETRRASLATLAAHYAETGPPKGEIVIVIGPPAPETALPGELDAALLAALQTESLKGAAEAVSQALGLPRREVYQRALQLKAGQDGDG